MSIWASICPSDETFLGTMSFCCSLDCSTKYSSGASWSVHNMTYERRLGSLGGNSQCVDGGAMFGNAPRMLWENWAKPDERHRIKLACRAMLVQESNGRLLLFEAGIGAFFRPELRHRYGVLEPGHVLLENLRAA